MLRVRVGELIVCDSCRDGFLGMIGSITDFHIAKYGRQVVDGILKHTNVTFKLALSGRFVSNDDLLCFYNMASSEEYDLMCM